SIAFDEIFDMVSSRLQRLFVGTSLLQTFPLIQAGEFVDVAAGLRIRRRKRGWGRCSRQIDGWRRRRWFLRHDADLVARSAEIGKSSTQEHLPGWCDVTEHSTPVHQAKPRVIASLVPGRPRQDLAHRPCDSDRAAAPAPT